MKKAICVLAVLAGFIVNSAYAYVPPSGFMVRTVVSKRRALKTLRIKSVVSAETAQVHFKEVTYYDSKTGVLRSVAQDDSGGALYVAERSLHKSPLADRVLMDGDIGSLVVALKAAQIPVVAERELQALQDEPERRAAETTSFGRMKGRFAWIIGKTETPQFWIEKDTFYPMKLVFPAESLEVRFENYRFNHDVPFPRAISAFRKEQLILREELGEVAVDVALPELKNSVAQGFTELGNSASMPVRELIQQFYERVR